MSQTSPIKKKDDELNDSIYNIELTTMVHTKEMLMSKTYQTKSISHTNSKSRLNKMSPSS